MQTKSTDRRTNSGTRWLAHALYGVSFAVAFPLAAFTCNGWLGLLVQALALSSAAQWLGQTNREAAPAREGVP